MPETTEKHICILEKMCFSVVSAAFIHRKCIIKKEKMYVQTI